MSYKKHVINPIGGMDFDSDDRVVEATDYRKAINIRNTVAYLENGQSSTNVKGNVLVSFNLPSGENKCIGTLDDKQNRTCIYMIWNSNNNHGIYRYYPEKTDSLNPYGVVEKIITFDFGWRKDRYITGIDLVNNELLYWTDNVRPRKINIKKANITNKRKCWAVYYPKFNHEDYVDLVAGFVLKKQDGSVILSSTLAIPNGSRKEMLNSIADQLNSGASGIVKADACNGFLEICEVGTDAWTLEVSLIDSNLDSLGAKATPLNWYGSNLIQRFFDRVKYPPSCNPLVVPKTDTDVNYNYIKQKVFQFRLQYVYDDAERSALGPISLIPLSATTCASDNQLNYINVDFNDSFLLDENIWTILKRVRVLIRERNSGVWKMVEDLDISQFYNLISSNLKASYNFYNDVAHTAIDNVLANKLYDKVPRYSESQKFIENRLVDGGVLDDYDAPCVDADLGIIVEDSKNEKTFNVTGKIRIANWQTNGNYENVSQDNNYAFPYGDDYLPLTHKSQPIIQLNTDEEDGRGRFPVFGGVAKISNAETQISQGNGYEQWLPEGGWPVYLAGTDYVDISRQIEVDFPQTSLNALDAQDATGAMTTWIKEDNDIYSTFNIKNVRPGRYIVRLASHWVSIGDKLEKGDLYDITKGKGYQNTSTNVVAIERGNGYEYFISEIEINVTNANIDAGTFYIDDLVNIKPEKTIADNAPLVGYSFSGYLLDNEGISTREQLEKALRVEKAVISIELLVDEISGWTYPSWTDHNGYWYRRHIDEKESEIGVVAVQIMHVISSTNSFNYSFNRYTTLTYRETNRKGVLADFSLNSSSFQFITAQQHGQVLSVVTNADYSKNLKTFITGYVKDTNGNGVSGVMVIYAQTGRTSRTDSFGYYKIAVYADTGYAYREWWTIQGKMSFFGTGFGPPPQGGIYPEDGYNNISNFFPDYTARLNTLTYNDFYSCILDFNGQDINIAILNPFGENAGTIAPPYSSTAWNIRADKIVSVLIEQLGTSQKRGGSYIAGIRYQDEAGRVCSVVEIDKAYIPFYGEDLNQYYPNDYPANTRKFGPARISVRLNSAPPIWAHMYQILLTKNIHQSKALQYLVNDVEYITSYDDDNETFKRTSFNSGDANQVMINLDNLADAFARDNDSQIGYSYEKGDRVRLVMDETGTYFEGIIEFKAVSYKSGNWLVLKAESALPEIKTGFLIEIFNRRLLEEEKVFYETGTCFKCTAPGTTLNQHSVTSFTIKGGESYFRKRTMRVIDENDSVFASFNYVIESFDISDFFESRDYNLGRIGIVDKDFKEIFRPTTLRVSNTFIPDTEINGLSNNEGIEDVETDREFGLIKKLIRVGSVLVSVHVNRTVSIYVNEKVFTDTTGNQTVGLSDSFLNTIRPLIGNYGTQHPESIVENENTAFGFDSIRGSTWMYSKAGLQINSENKAVNYFRNIVQGGIWDCPAVYDPFYKEYILTIGKRGAEFDFTLTTTEPNLNVSLLNSVNPSGILVNDSIEINIDGTMTKFQVYFVSGNQIGILGDISKFYDVNSKVKAYTRGERETIAYSDLKNRWTTFYSFEQDFYCGVRKQMVSFKNGQMYLHDEGLPNVFNGVFTPSELWLIVNPEPLHPKVWFANELQQKQDDGNCDWEAYEVSNREGQVSRILKSSWINKQDHWYSEFKRNLNTPVANPILNGERLRSVTLLVKLVNNRQGVINIWAYITNFEFSERTRI